MLCDKGQRIRSPCWLVAAALSAAATLRKPIGDTPNAQAEPSQKKSTPSNAIPLFGREGSGERRFSQRSGLSPQNLPFVPHRLLGREREGGGFSSRSSSPSHILIVLLRFVPVFALVNLGGEGDI